MSACQHRHSGASPFATKQPNGDIGQGAASFLSGRRHWPCTKQNKARHKTRTKSELADGYHNTALSVFGYINIFGTVGKQNSMLPLQAPQSHQPALWTDSSLIIASAKATNFMFSLLVCFCAR